MEINRFLREYVIAGIKREAEKSTVLLTLRINTSLPNQTTISPTVNGSFLATVMESDNDGDTDFWVGLSLAVLSSVFIGTSFILKKKGLLRLSLRAGQGGYGYLKEWLWWAGLILMGVGEACNFIAYAFAPASLVTPLGALSVLVSAVLASRMLGEHLNLLGKLGCFICVMGSTVVVIHSPKEIELQTIQEVAAKLFDPMFLAYVLLVAMNGIVLIFVVAPMHGASYPLVYVTITGTIGSLSVMGCKGLGVALKQTFSGDNQLGNWVTWLLLIAVVLCITVQMNYLNKALDVYNTSVVTPMLYVVFTICVIVASAILFQEWRHLSVVDIVGNVCGFLIIVSGVFILQAFKDMKISFGNLPNIHRDREALETNNTSSSTHGYEMQENLLDTHFRDNTRFGCRPDKRHQWNGSL